MELSLYDAQNLIRDWMEHGQSNEAPLLDEDDTQSDTPMSSRVVIECDDATSLQKITGKASLVEWVDKTVGDTHRQAETKDHEKEGQRKKIECLQAMKKLLVRKGAQNTKNPT
jgi:hypothetical protein